MSVTRMTVLHRETHALSRAAAKLRNANYNAVLMLRAVDQQLQRITPKYPRLEVKK